MIMEHLLPQKVEFILMIGISVFWILAYILIILKGFKDQTCGMPLAAICANIAWEFLLTFMIPFHPLQQIVTLIWFLLDCIILLQYLYYSKKEKKPYSRRTVYGSVFALIVIAFLVQYAMAIEFNDTMSIYSAFGINLMMSIFFVKMLMTNDLQGQSLAIAYCKLIGTLCASILCYSFFPQSVLLTLIYILILILDLVYILLIYYQSIKVIHKTTIHM